MPKVKSLYLSKVQLKAELDRCLNCKTKPCMNACPVDCNPQEFINHAKEGNYDEAVKTITRNNAMGQTCGLICPDKFCMNACTRRHIDFSVNIPKVQATILENYRKNSEEYQGVKFNGRKAAVIGAGPAGMAAASFLAKSGCRVCVFEASETIGGALNLIPEDRLPHAVIEKDWSYIFNPELISIKFNTEIKDPEALLDKGFDGVIVATGEPNCTNLGIEGEESMLCYMEYLKNPQKYQTAGAVAVIGGGAVAVDCALTAHDSGASEVEMFVRRKLSDMKVTKNEYMELISSKIDITTMTSPVRAEKKSDGSVSLYTCKNRFEEGRLRALPNSTIERSGFTYVIKAVGSYAEKKSDSDKIIYAGDCKHGGSTIVEAIASGREAASFLSEIISKKAA